VAARTGITIGLRRLKKEQSVWPRGPPSQRKPGTLPGPMGLPVPSICSASGPNLVQRVDQHSLGVYLSRRGGPTHDGLMKLWEASMEKFEMPANWLKYHAKPSSSQSAALPAAG
jgi:hypothetical protein